MEAEVSNVVNSYVNIIRPTLRHVTPQFYYTFDIDPASISDGSAFINAVVKHPNYVRHFVPKPNTSEKGYHIELRK